MVQSFCKGFSASVYAVYRGGKVRILLLSAILLDGADPFEVYSNPMIICCRDDGPVPSCRLGSMTKSDLIRNPDGLLL